MGPAIVGYLCFAAFGFSISALVLIGACRIAGLRTPNFFPAMMICLCVNLAVFVVILGAGAAIGVATGMPRLSGSRQMAEIIDRGWLVGLALSPFISAGIFTVMLDECSYLRGLLVWFCQFVVLVLAGLVIAFIGKAMNFKAPKAALDGTNCVACSTCLVSPAIERT